MNVTLRQLRAFAAVARTGSFTLAAESLFVTQSALSGLIKDFERALGLRVIDRSTRRIRLSEVGRELYPLVDKILHDLDAVLVDVAQRKALKSGRVRVAVPQLMAATLLPRLIAGYRERQPDIEVQLLDTAVEGIMSKVLSGEVDIGIGPERNPSSGIVAEPLFEAPFLAVFPAGHPLDTKEEVRWADLAGHSLITLQGPFAEKLDVELRHLHGALALAPKREVAFMSTALAMVNAGLGVTVCSGYARMLVELYRLEMRPLVEPVVGRRFYVFTQRARSLTPAAEDFRSFVFEYVAERPEVYR